MDRNLSNEEQALIQADTIYDTSVTRLYKAAYLHGVPVRLIIAFPAENGQIQYQALSEFIGTQLANGVTFEQLYPEIHDYNPSITPTDLAMSYYAYLDRLQQSGEAITNDDIVSTLNAAQQVMEQGTSETYRTYDDVQKLYASWYNSIATERQNDNVRLLQILDIQGELRLVDKAPYEKISPVRITSALVAFYPTIRSTGQYVVPQDGLEIFDHFQVSRFTPYVKYNDALGRSYSKVYQGDKIEHEPDYKVTIIPEGNSHIANAIYLTLWLGEEDQEMSTSVHDLFMTVTYFLDTNYLTIKTPVNPMNELPNMDSPAVVRVREAFTDFLDFGPDHEVKVHGDFYVWNFEYDESSLLDMILLSEVLSAYLYVEEKDKAYPLKKRLDIHYRSLFTDIEEGFRPTNDPYISISAAVSMTFNPRAMEQEQVVQYFDYSVLEGTSYPVEVPLLEESLPVGTPYINIRISQAESREVVNRFIVTFGLLMKYYRYNRSPIDLLYRDLLPEVVKDIPALVTEASTKNTKAAAARARRRHAAMRTVSNAHNLMAQVPQIFGPGYTSKFQGEAQPHLIEEDEVATWQNKLNPATGQPYEVLAFPNEDPYYFVCTGAKKPYPGVAINKTSTKNEYPYIPCCYANEQISTNKRTLYKDYLNGVLPHIEVGAKADKKISTNKILNPDRIAFIGKSIDATLRTYESDVIDIVRYGTVRSPNSLIHCVLAARQEDAYISANPHGREAIAIEYRAQIAASVYPELMKQELYDYSNEEIMQKLADPAVFLDPLLFYRAIEEYFKLNLFIFAPADEYQSDTSGIFEVPRFRLFHAQAQRLDRPVILILRNLGSESNDLEYPQCELIVDYDEKNFGNSRMLFELSMNELCQQILRESSTIFTWTFETSPVARFHVYQNLYYFVDYARTIGYQLISQYIDENGKARAFTFKLNETESVTLVVPPSQPENLPHRKELASTSIFRANELLGTPSRITRNSQGQLTGFWYSVLGLQQGVYIPLVPTVATGYENIPLGEANPLGAGPINYTSRLTEMKRTLNIVVQVVRWVYDIARILDPTLSPEFFAAQFMKVVPLDRPSYAYYEVSAIPRRLAQVNDTNEALDYIASLAPTLSDGTFLHMYDQKFYDRITQMLKDYTVNHEEPASTGVITGYYRYPQDFHQEEATRVFTSSAEQAAWLESNSRDHNVSRATIIRTRIEDKYSEELSPYLFQDDDGRIYLVQNVVGGNLERALKVVDFWFAHKVNYGPNAPQAEIDKAHMILGLSPNGTLVAIQDNTRGNTVYGQILYYGTPDDRANTNRAQRYAALLEIL